MSAAERPLIAIAGLAIESSTFSPARTGAAAFHPRRGDEVFERYPFMSEGSELRRAARWLPALTGSSLPGGTVTAAAFEQLSDEIVERLAAMPPLDGFYFDIHGAMSVEGIDDAESVLLGRIRAVIGAEVIVSASMDLHGNVSRELLHQVDLITCYRTAPHEDTAETRERAIRNLIEHLDAGSPRPVKAWIPVPVLLPGEKTSTRMEPATSIYADVAVVAESPGVLDAAIWVGYAWADEPRNRAVVVVTGPDEAAVSAGAEQLAGQFWVKRKEFGFVAPTATFDVALDRALASTSRPFFISDSGDNPTAGGAGDVTWGLTALLDRPEFTSADGPTVIYASIPGAAGVTAAIDAGVGHSVTITVGAEVDDRHAPPLTITGIVHSIRTGDKDAMTEVVVRVGSVHVIVTGLRKPYHHEHDFLDLELDARAAAIVIVKIGYLEPELFDMSADWLLALTPGGVDQDLARLGHHRIRRPMFPFDVAMETPDLSARIIPASTLPLDGIDE